MTRLLITGGAGGIGRAAVDAALRRGWQVAVVDRDPVDIPGASCHVADVTDRAALDAAVAAAVDDLGGLDAVAANAGILLEPGTVRSMSDRTFEQIIEVNVGGPWNTVRATLPHIEASRGYYLLTSSLAVVINGVLNSPYAMSKAAVEHLARAMRVELAGDGIGVGVCYWGLIQTPMYERSSATAAIREYVSHFPSWAGKTLPPEQAGEAMVRGIERRSLRVCEPRYVHAALLLRDLVARSDRVLARHAGIRESVRVAER